MFSRREVVIGGSLTILIGSGCKCLAHDSQMGCHLSAQEAQSYLRTDEQFQRSAVPNSGNRDFDYASAQTLGKLSDIFGVLPTFVYFSKRNSRNAFATPKNFIRANDGSVLPRDGTILFGRDLLFEMMALPEGPDIAFSAICAHEFAHIAQFKLGIIPLLNRAQRNVRRSELHSDFLAGYFAGRRKLEKPDFNAAVYATTMEKFGDLETWSTDHHGTPKQRADAIVLGFHTAFRDKKSFGEAILVGANFVSTL